MNETRRARQLVGIDVGGTFTDLFFIDSQSGEFGVAKLPTSVDNQAVALIEGIEQHVPVTDVASIVHGTTTGTNAILERKGARTGLITTQGFRDVLEMRRRDRPNTWGLWGSFDPLSPRDLRAEVPERMLASGEVHRSLDESAVRDAAIRLRDAGAEAVAIVFMNAYANPAHERRARDIVTEVWPNDWVNCSSDILPEIREFERASTTAMNAYLQPVVGRYLDSLATRLRDSGFDGSVFIVQSNGGVMTLDTAAKLPVRTALSGPAAGVMAAAHIAREAGMPNVVTCDLGGTSFDVSLVDNGQSVLSAQTTIDFGLVIRTPMVEITTIGAGGGSIARLDAGGILQVGPESAGSRPGPVAYGLGNTRPTLTDANIVLGRINAQRPIGGTLGALDAEAAKVAIQREIAQPLGLGVYEAAAAIVTVANSRMAGAIRLVSIERGFDPKQFAAMPFGGGGGLHTGALMQEVGLASSLIPRFPGITSAMGCLIADMRHDRVQTVNLMLMDTDVGELVSSMRATESELASLLDAADVPFDGRETRYEFDMSYLGQTHTVAVPIVADGSKDAGIDHTSIGDAFTAHYTKVYGRSLQGQAVRINAVRTAVIGYRPQLDLAAMAPVGGSVTAAYRGERDVWFGEGFRTTKIYDRLTLPVDARIEGPAILEQPDTTIVIDPGLIGRVDSFGNLIMERI